MERLPEPSNFLNPSVKLVSSTRVTLTLAFLCLLLITLVPSLMIVLHRRRLFARLPPLPKMGVIGSLLGSVDIYFYAMRHLTIEEAIHEAALGLFQIESVRKEGLFACHLGPIPTVAFFRADTVGQLMSSSSANNKQTTKAAKTTQTSKGDQFRFLRPWLGKGLVMSEGEHWRRHRKLINPSFAPVVLRSFLPSFNRNVEIMLARVASSSSSTLDLRPLVKDLAMDILTETTMGRAVGAQLQGTNRKEYIEPVKGALVCFSRRLLNPLLHFDLLYRWCSADGRENARHVKQIHRYVRRVIRERKEARQTNMDNSVEQKISLKSSRFCFLDLLLETHQAQPDAFTEVDIHDEVNSLMFAGQDSTSVTTTMALALVAGDQRVQGLIIKELEEIFANETDPLGCPITGEHCQQMKYLEAVLNEALRLYSPVPNGTVKKIEEEEGLVVNGLRIPKGTSAAILYNLMHRDSAVFPQPDRFIPERFLEGEEDSLVDPTFAFLPRPVPHGHFIPFGVGARSCIGLRFAFMEMKLVLAGVLRRYRLVALQPRDSLRFGIAAILTIRSPVMVRFEERREGLFFTGKI